MDSQTVMNINAAVAGVAAYLTAGGNRADIAASFDLVAAALTSIDAASQSSAAGVAVQAPLPAAPVSPGTAGTPGSAAGSSSSTTATVPAKAVEQAQAQDMAVPQHMINYRTA